MRTQRALPFLALMALAALAASPATAAPYLDTKKRFSVDVPAGWKLAPMPGDAEGMVFKKDLDGVPGVLRVSVRPLTPGETPEGTLERVQGPFRDEIGFRAGADLPAQLGLLPAVRRTFTVYASGDAKTVRSVEVYVAHAFGHAHVVHFETLERARSRFARDVDRFVGTYECLAGRALVGPLIGKWLDQTGGPELVLLEDGRFSLGPLAGTWRADGARLTLRVKSGEEHYRYALDGAALKLESWNLGDPKTYLRQGPARFVEKPAPRKPTALTRDMLVGRWKVLDQASTEVLVLHLAPSGSVSFGGLSGRWSYSTGRLTIASTAGVTITYSASLTGSRLSLEGGDLERPLTLEREER